MAPAYSTFRQYQGVKWLELMGLSIPLEVPSIENRAFAAGACVEMQSTPFQRKHIATAELSFDQYVHDTFSLRILALKIYNRFCRIVLAACAETRKIK